MLNAYMTIYEASNQFSKAVVPFYSPTKMYESSS